MDNTNTLEQNGFLIKIVPIFISVYLIIKTSISYESSSGTILACLLFMICCVLYLKMQGIHLRSNSIPVILLSIAFIFSAFFNGNILIRKISLIISIIIFLFAIYKGTNDTFFMYGCDTVPVDIIQCFLYGVDASNLPKMRWKDKNGKLISKVLPITLKILLGFLLSAPIFIFVLLMLLYDSSFQKLLNDIFTFDLDKLLIELSYFFYSIPVFLYLFLSLSSCVNTDSKHCFDPNTFVKIKSRISWLSSVTVISMVLPVLALYTIFFISQWDYYTLAFYGYVPNGYSYAEYAREGFFELCAVSVVNLLLMMSCTWFSNTKTKESKIVLKLITIAISIFSLVLISTAASKLFLYIKQYGLTPLRVYSSWGMIVLTVVFILFIIKQFSDKLPLYSMCIFCSAILFLALSFTNLDAKIAEYNTKQFIQGNLDTIDIDLLNSLGDSATPSLIMLNDYYSSLSEDEKFVLINEHSFNPKGINIDELRYYYTNVDTQSSKWYSTTFPFLLAKKFF